MQLNLSDNSEHCLVQAYRGLIDFIKPIANILGCALIGLIIVCGLFLFGAIVWAFLEMLLKAVGQF